MSLLDLREGDLIIKRASNGFVVISPSSEGRHDISVYEFREELDEGIDEADAMLNLLYEHYPHIFQSKHKGGLSVSMHEKGRASED